MASSREILVRAGLAIASAAAVLLAAEAAVRVSGYAPRRGGAARLISPGRKVLLDCYSLNPRGYFDVDLRDPGTLAHYRALGVQRLDDVAPRFPHAVEFRYNSAGFRGPEPGPRREGTRRIVVLGDSFTEGQGVKEADTYPRVLGRLLDAAEPGRWEVLNCGRRASDFPELRLTFARILRYDPDLVIYGMVLNDAEQSGAFQSRQAEVADWILDQGRGGVGRRYSRLDFFESRLLFLARERIETGRLRRKTTRWYLDMYGEANREGWQRTQNDLREMDQRLRERGGRLVVALWPLLMDLEGDYPFAPVTEAVGGFCRSAGIPWHDLRPALGGRPTDTLWVVPSDLHPNEIAHRLAAASLVHVVRAFGAPPVP